MSHHGRSPEPVQIEWDENGCTLIVWGEDEEDHAFVIDPAQLHAVVAQEIGPWIAEMEQARREFDARKESDTVLGFCPHGVDLDRQLCEHGCRV